MPRYTEASARRDVRERQVRRMGKKALAGIQIFLFLNLACQDAVQAVTYQVTNNNNTGLGSLRKAIQNVNAGAGGGDIIQWSGTDGTITLSSPLPALLHPVTLDPNGATAIVIDGQLTVANASGVTVDVSAFNQTLGSLSGGGSNGGNILLGGSTLITGVDDTDTEYDGVMSGLLGGLDKEGAGTFTLGGQNTYTGSTSIGQGILQTATANAISNQSSLYLANDPSAIFDLNGFDQSVGSLVGGGTDGGDISLGNATLTVGSDNSSSEYDGIISGAGNLTKVGSGMLVLGGQSTYSGATSIQQGTLQMNAVWVLPSQSAVVLANASGVTLDLNNFDQSIGSLTGGGTSGGTVNIANATLTTGNDNTDTEFDGTIVGNGSLDKEGSGTFTLGGQNTYTGQTTLGQGTLRMGVANALSNQTPVVLANAAGVTFDLNGDDQSIGSLAGGGGLGGAVNMANATLTTGNDNTDTEFDGVITGAGTLVKAGAGTFTLGGQNTYTGTTLIQHGTLRAAAADTLPAQTAVTLAANAGVTLDLNSFDQSLGSLSGGGTTGGNVTLGGATLTTGSDNTSTAYGGTIAGNGSLIKTGNGTFTLSGNNTYIGGTTVDAGILKMGVANALSAAGDVTTSPNGLYDLNGFSQSIANLTNHGTTHLRAATLQVNGNYDGAGTLVTTLQNPAAYGRMNVNGTANLTGGTLQVSLISPYIPAAGSSFTVVTAGLVTGQFGQLVQPAALSLQAIYSASAVTLSVPENAEIPYLTSAEDPNERSVAAILDRVRPTATGDWATVTGTLNTLSAPELRSAFQQMSPISLRAIPQTSVLNAEVQTAAVSQRIAADLDGTTRGPFSATVTKKVETDTLLALLDEGQDFGAREMPPPEPPSTCQGFATGLDTFGKLGRVTDSVGLQPGYTFGSQGITAGGDCRLTPQSTLGLSAGFLDSHTSSDLNASTVDGQSLQAGLYGIHKISNFNLNAYAGGALDSYKVSRNVTFGGLNRTAAGSPTGQSIMARGGMGYAYKTRFLTLQPAASVLYDRVTVNSYTETGAGALNLNLDSQVSQSLRTEIGAHLSKIFEAGSRRIAPSLSAGWQHEYRDQSRAISAEFADGSGAFSVRSADPGRDTALLGAGLHIQWTSALFLDADYNGEYGRANFVAHRVNAGFHLKF